MSNSEKISVIILAGGKGIRMKSNLPKVLEEINGKPMISYLLESVSSSGIDDKPIIVVGYKKDEVIAKLGPAYDYAIQHEQLGTGHAVRSAEKEFGNRSNHVMVLYGDHPFIRPGTIKKLAQKHIETGGKITMGVVRVDDFKDWRAFFYTDSRIIRDGNGKITKDVQFRDASEEEKKIKEVNPCYFCFEANWLWGKLRTLNKDNNQKQYYLTDLVKIAIEEKNEIESMEIDPYEALGADSKEELAVLEKISI